MARQAVTMDTELRHRLARIARRHHAVATREEMLGEGVTDEAIEWALATAQIEALFPGVYRINGAPDTWRTRAVAAQRRVERQLHRKDPVDAPKPLAVIGGAAAAHLHGLPGFSRPPELTVVTSRRCRSTAAEIRRRNSLTEIDVVEIDRIPVTSLAWTCVEEAGNGVPQERGDLVAHVLGTNRLRPGQLLGAAHRAEGVPGRSAVIGEVTAITGAVSHVRSVAEKVLAVACEDLALPTPALNRAVTTSAGTVHELDLSWPDALVDVEVDGPHHLLPSQRRRDRQRDGELRADGWEVTRFPVEEVDEDPAGVARRIGATLGRRATGALLGNATAR